MSDLLVGRRFQAWLYSVSHGLLLLRSPATAKESNNIDIVFAGVEYMALPRHLEELALDEPSGEEVSKLEQILGKDLSDKKIAILASRGIRHVVVSAKMSIESNSLDLFEYPFQLGGREKP